MKGVAELISPDRLMIYVFNSDQGRKAYHREFEKDSHALEKVLKGTKKSSDFLAVLKFSVLSSQTLELDRRYVDAIIFPKAQLDAKVYTVTFNVLPN